MAGVANEGKKLSVVVGGDAYDRIPIKTRLVEVGDALDPVIEDFAVPVVRDGDWLFITEKIVAISQGRSYPIAEVTPRPLANFLARYVTKTPYGIGLGMPETMEMALRECGVPRILLAAAVAAVTKPFGRKGDFYRIAGSRARGIDGPTSGTIPPYNSHVVLVPLRPTEVARHVQGLIAERSGVTAEVFVVDINDIGGNILGSTADRATDRRLVEILRDNPLGQGHQSTPLGVVRRAE